MTFRRKKTTAPATVNLLGVAQVDAETVVASYAATNQKLYTENEELKARLEFMRARLESQANHIADLEGQRRAVLAAVGADKEIANLEARVASLEDEEVDCRCDDCVDGVS